MTNWGRGWPKPQTVYGGTFDNENAAVEAAIKTRHKAKLGKVEAVVDFAFTVGPEETDAMASKQVSRCAMLDRRMFTTAELAHSVGFSHSRTF